MLRLVWCVCAALVMCVVDALSASAARNTATVGAVNKVSARPAVELVENIRRQLMQDNYDYVYVEGGEETTVTKLSSAMRGSVTQQINNKTETIKPAVPLKATTTSPAMTYKRVTFKEYEDNSSTPTFSMNEGSQKYKAYEEVDKLQGVTAGRQQKRNKSSESKIHPLVYDLLYYIDDKHLRRNNYVSEDTSKVDNEDTLSDSGENNFYTTVVQTSPKRITGRLYQGYRQRSRMYGVRRERPKNQVDNKKRNKHRRKRPHFRHRISGKHRQSNMPLWKANTEGKVNSQSNDEPSDENMNEQVKDTAYFEQNESTTEAAHTEHNEDQLEQELNNNNTTYDDYQNNNRNETASKDVAKNETRHNESRLDKDDVIQDDQSDTNSDEQFYRKDNNRVDTRRRSNNELHNGKTKQQNITTTASVKYKLLKIRSGRGGRRSGPGVLQVVQESGATGVVLWGLDARPLPQFRLPAPRRQYMRQHSPLRPALEEHLPHRKHRRHH